VPALRGGDGEWIRPDFILPGLNNLIIEYKGMDDFEYNEKFERKLMKSAASRKAGHLKDFREVLASLL